MDKLRAGIVGFVTLLMLTPGIVLAKNYCVGGFPNANYILVGLGFTVPAKGTCAAWTGFNKEGNFPTAGTGCTSSNGSNLSLTLTTGSKSFVEIDVISLSLPSQIGEVSGQSFAMSLVDSFGPISGISGGACSTKTIPAVTENEAVSPRPGDDGDIL